MTAILAGMSLMMLLNFVPANANANAIDNSYSLNKTEYHSNYSTMSDNFLRRDTPGRTNSTSRYDQRVLWWAFEDSLDFYNHRTLTAFYKSADATGQKAAHGKPLATSFIPYQYFLDLPAFEMFEIENINHEFVVNDTAPENLGPVPEPATLILLAVGMIALLMARKQLRAAKVSNVSQSPLGKRRS